MFVDAPQEDEDEGAAYANDEPDEEEMMAPPVLVVAEVPVKEKTPEPKVDEVVLARIARNKAAAMERMRMRQEEEARAEGKEKEKEKGSTAGEERGPAAKSPQAKCGGERTKEEAEEEGGKAEEPEPIRRTFRKADREAARVSARLVESDEEEDERVEEGSAEMGEGEVEDNVEERSADKDMVLILYHGYPDMGEEEREGDEASPEGSSQDQDQGAHAELAIADTLVYEVPEERQESEEGEMCETLAYKAPEEAQIREEAEMAETSAYKAQEEAQEEMQAAEMAETLAYKAPEEAQEGREEEGDEMGLGDVAGEYNAEAGGEAREVGEMCGAEEDEDDDLMRATSPATQAEGDFDLVDDFLV